MTIPSTFSVVATLVAEAIAVVLGTVGIVNIVARAFSGRPTVGTIIETLRIVALFITFPVVKDFPAVDAGIAVAPRVPP